VVQGQQTCGLPRPAVQGQQNVRVTPAGGAGAKAPAGQNPAGA
jgi:hypothetical protein